MRPTRPATDDHRRHDALLVAQHAAGDPLSAEQQRAAAALVAGCAACARLAADLRDVSRAVASEPMPRRRRDFRIAPQKAEELRGSALQRLLRRFALPDTRALQPVAAGVMSLGLLLVVVGTALPLADRQAAPAAPAVLVPESPAPIAGEDATATQAPPVERAVATAPAPDEVAAREAAPPAVDVAGAEPAANATDQAGQGTPVGEAPGQGAGEAGSEAGDTAAGDQEMLMAVPETPADAQAYAQAASSGEPTQKMAPLESASADTAVAESGMVDDGSGDQVGPEGAQTADTAEAAVGAQAADTAGTSASGTLEEGGLTLTSVLVVIGLVLAIAGLLLLGFLWLARRTAADPLMR